MKNPKARGGGGGSIGTRENKLKEQWGEWIRRKTKTYTINKTIEFKSVKDSQELKKDFQITFVPGKASTHK